MYTLTLTLTVNTFVLSQVCSHRDGQAEFDGDLLYSDVYTGL